MSKKGHVGAVRRERLDWRGLAAMEAHGKRQDLSGQSRRVRDAPPLVYGTLNLRDARRAHMDGVAQTGQTAGLHLFVQFPTNLMPSATLADRQAMLDHAVAFSDEFFGGRAVFAARLDQDELGQHGVDVFVMPTFERRYKDGRVALRSSISKHSKAAARRLLGRDDPRAQGTAMQHAWHVYLRDTVGLVDVQLPDRKTILARDRVEPEVYQLRQDRAKLDRDRSRLTQDARIFAQEFKRAGRAVPRSIMQLLSAATR